MTDQHLLDTALIERVAEKAGLSTAGVLDAVAEYNADFAGYGDEVYTKVTTRLAHWLNYHKRDWFSYRIDLYLDHLIGLPRPLLIDIGFSVPYTRAREMQSDRVPALLVEKERSSLEFCKLLEEHTASRPAHEVVLLADVEDRADQMSIARNATLLATTYSTKSILLAASEVVEHLMNAEEFWRLACLIHSKVRVPLHLYVTLPVGTIIPTHKIEFKDEQTALRYLKERMHVYEYAVLRPQTNMPHSPHLEACVCAFGTIGPNHPLH